MSCPMYIDYTRECLETFKFIPSDTLEYCNTEKYLKCPFYSLLNKKKDVCSFVSECCIFIHYKNKDFKNFIKVVDKYCVNSKHSQCQRFIRRTDGVFIPENLHPDGSNISYKKNLT